VFIKSAEVKTSMKSSSLNLLILDTVS
jgi:hypothetical protein